MQEQSAGHHARGMISISFNLLSATCSWWAQTVDVSTAIELWLFASCRSDDVKLNSPGLYGHFATFALRTLDTAHFRFQWFLWLWMQGLLRITFSNIVFVSRVGQVSRSAFFFFLEKRLDTILKLAWTCTTIFSVWPCVERPCLVFSTASTSHCTKRGLVVNGRFYCTLYMLHLPLLPVLAVSASQSRFVAKLYSGTARFPEHSAIVGWNLCCSNRTLEKQTKKTETRNRSRDVHIPLRLGLDLSFWSFLTFLHHGVEKVEGHLVWKLHKNSKEKLVKCATEVAPLHKVSIQSRTQNRPSPKVQSLSQDWI